MGESVNQRTVPPNSEPLCPSLWPLRPEGRMWYSSNGFFEGRTFPHSPLAPPARRVRAQKEVPVALYESVFIIHPSTSDDDVNAIIERVREIIAKTGGNVVHVETWGRKKLAYEVKKQRKGNYVLLNYEGGRSVVQELETNCRPLESVLKFMTIKVDPRIGLPSTQPPSA